jgi:hypothetical protein
MQRQLSDRERKTVLKYLLLREAGRRSVKAAAASRLISERDGVAVVAYSMDCGAARQSFCVRDACSGPQARLVLSRALWGSFEGVKRRFVE